MTLLLSQITQRGNIFSTRKTSDVGKLMCVCPCLKSKYMCAGLMHHSCSNMVFSFGLLIEGWRLSISHNLEASFNLSGV